MLKVVVGALVALIAGCGFANSGGGDDDGSGSGSDTGSGAQCDLAAMTPSGVSTLSGCADAGTDDGARGTARFNNPVNLALGPSG
ncbi:MAG TPA: hypothetical protein VGC41_01640, partial [Kofleriaceae bacterium]